MDNNKNIPPGKLRVPMIDKLVIVYVIGIDNTDMTLKTTACVQGYPVEVLPLRDYLIWDLLLLKTHHNATLVNTQTHLSNCIS